MEREDDLRNLNGDVSSQPDGDVEDDNPLVLSPQAFTAESACIACPTLDVYLKMAEKRSVSPGVVAGVRYEVLVFERYGTEVSSRFVITTNNKICLCSLNIASI
ncbi:hypothetical protein Rs2_18883 [Raphanus sativus]|uniref:Uncharacterized protein LOC130511503 n=1 Tax=Raphanus sativus TaxID=3726 RepID=A0A9W3DL97_RAPSA|nr:uncharacterized protein LOC130511503 [Raphanus sativus]KAJ4904932.1 hypothetical protein Rs2_18883 [Raphanus sativus]